MQPKLPFWKTEYKHDRRKHRHQCRSCKRILNEGDIVYMTRIGSRKTYAMHDDCAKPGSQNYNSMREWAFQHLIRLYGLSEFDRKDWPKIEKLREQLSVKKI